jgi:hypothetical protein
MECCAEMGTTNGGYLGVYTILYTLYTILIHYTLPAAADTSGWAAATWDPTASPLGAGCRYSTTYTMHTILTILLLAVPLPSKRHCLRGACIRGGESAGRQVQRALPRE